jgi:hypothetical protein
MIDFAADIAFHIDPQKLLHLRLMTAGFFFEFIGRSLKLDRSIRR